jgi:lysozyme family protein
MANDNDFQEIMRFTFKWEIVRDRRGNVIAEHDPHDPGGVTKYGIDKAAHPNLSVSDIENLTEAQAIAIYKKENWENTHAVDLPKRFAQVVFDMSVLDGTSRAIRFLQRAVGAEVDGEVGPDTISTTNEAASTNAKQNTALDIMLDLREQRYRDLVVAKPGLQRYLQGWLNRSHDLRVLIGIA